MVRCSRTVLMLIAFAFCTSCVIVYWIAKSPQLNQYQILVSYKSKAMSHGPKVILLWNDFFGNANWNLPSNVMDTSYFKDSHCPVTNCILTSSKNYLEYEHMYDAIVFHTAQAFPLLQSVPKMRHPEQTYVFALMESPAETKHVLSDEGSFYNLTMTYRLDSDILWPYAFVEDVEAEVVVAPSLSPPWRRPPVEFGDEDLQRLVGNKTKLATWFVSHCETYSKREDLVRSLQQYIPVDVYGKCGNLSCPHGSPKCDQMLNEDYKFYFAMENALCTDYITEKLFEKMQRQIVPVVFGGANYTRFIPPHSFIDASDFQTTKQLADYLIYLDKNPDEYMRYFWWRQHYKITYRSPFCDLCTKLNNPSEKERLQIYSNIEEWWFGNSCRTEARIQFT